MKTGYKIISLFLCIFMLLSALVACGSDKGELDGVIEVNFSERSGTDIQFVKKINAHCPSWILHGNMANTLNKDVLYTFNRLKDFNSEYMRSDIFFGYDGLGSTIANSKTLTGETKLEYGKAELFTKSLQNVNVTPYFILNGIPEYAQTESYAHKPDYEKWALVVENVARYFKENGMRAAYETSNEPDLAHWQSSVYDMMKTSAVATAAIRRGDENAVVSALGLAFVQKFLNKTETYNGETVNNFERFLIESRKEAFPDALAWHYYGSEDGLVKDNFDSEFDFLTYLNLTHEYINNYSSEYEELHILQQHLTEYHPFAVEVSVEDQTTNVGKMFESIDPLLMATDVTEAFWPMWFNTIMFHVVDGQSYRNTPAFHVLWSYGRLPIERRTYTGAPKDIGVYAAADSSRAGVIVYNNGKEDKNIKINLNNIGFNVATSDVYEISNEHPNYNSGIDAPYQVLHKNSRIDSFEATIKANSAYYIELNDASGKSELDTPNNSIELLKKEYYFDTRAYGMPYAESDEDTLTTYVSMANNETGKTAIAMRAKVKNQLTISYEKWGDFVKEGGMLGFRID